MEIIKEGKDNATIIMGGEVDLSNSHLLKETLNMLYEEGFKVVTLDFSQVTGIGSAGLGKLLLFQKRFKERGGGLKIINIKSKHIQKMFNMIQLARVIEIENSG